MKMDLLFLLENYIFYYQTGNYVENLNILN